MQGIVCSSSALYLRASLVATGSEEMHAGECIESRTGGSRLAEEAQSASPLRCTQHRSKAGYRGSKAPALCTAQVVSELLQKGQSA